VQMGSSPRHSATMTRRIICAKCTDDEAVAQTSDLRVDAFQTKEISR
jgi:hypothetical protein